MSSLLKPTEAYLVPDLLQDGLKLVFCGTALGHESARQKAYYARSGNQFWPVLYRCGFTPRQLAPREYVEVLNYGIGLTDLCKHACGNDDQLPSNAFDRAALERKILFYQPRYLAFTSKKSAAVFLMRKTKKIAYGLQPERIGSTQLFVLPSTSGSGRKYWCEEPWEVLAKEIRQ